MAPAAVGHDVGVFEFQGSLVGGELIVSTSV